MNIEGIPSYLFGSISIEDPISGFDKMIRETLTAN
jgi:hypothetical protein